jgi:hypothetical protein
VAKRAAGILFSNLRQALDVVRNFMRHLLFTIIIAFIFLSSCAQSSSKKYYFSEIGLTVNVSKEYSLTDSFPRIKFLDSLQNPITDTERLKSLKAELLTTLLFIESKNQQNSMSINIQKISDSSVTNFVDSTTYFEFQRNMIILSTKQYTTDFFSSTSQLKINNILLTYFNTSYKYNGKTINNGIYYTQVKGYYLTVKIDYESDKEGEKLKQICDLYEKCFEKLNSSDKTKDDQIAGYMQAVDKLLSIHDNQFRELICLSNEG